MDARQMLTMLALTQALEQEKDEVKNLHTVIAILVDKAGGSVTFTMEDIDAFFDKNLQLRTRKQGADFTWFTQPSGTPCNCALCQGTKMHEELARAESPSKERH